MKAELLDRLIAHARGWVLTGPDRGDGLETWQSPSGDMYYGFQIPKVSSERAQAMKLLNEWGGPWNLEQASGYCDAVLRRGPYRWAGRDESLEVAICLAFLKARGAKVPK